MPVQLNSIEGVMRLPEEMPERKEGSLINSTARVTIEYGNNILKIQGQVKIGLNREKTAIQLCECQSTEYALWKWEYQDENTKEMYRKRADKFIASEHDIFERSEE